MSDYEHVLELTLPILTHLTLSMACMSSTCSDSLKDCCQGCVDGGQDCTGPYCRKSSHAETKEHTPADTLRIYLFSTSIVLSSNLDEHVKGNFMHTSALKTPAGY